MHITTIGVVLHPLSCDAPASLTHPCVRKAGHGLLSQSDVWTCRLGALLNALPPAQAEALNAIINTGASGNVVKDLSDVQSNIGPAIGVPAPAIAEARGKGVSDRKLLHFWS